MSDEVEGMTFGIRLLVVALLVNVMVVVGLVALIVWAVTS